MKKDEKVTLKSEYSKLKKKELVNILAEVPVQFVYDIIEKMSNDAFTKFQDVYIDSLKKINLLETSIQNNDNKTENLDKVLFELDKKIKQMENNYNTLNNLLRILERSMYGDFVLE